MGPNDDTAFTGLQLGPLTVDLDRGVIMGEHGPSGLTPRAEDLLLLLARRAGTLVTREDMLETVWADRVVEDAVISHCVWQIRRAIGASGKQVLQTRPKRGYMLVVGDADWIRGSLLTRTERPQPEAGGRPELPESPDGVEDGRSPVDAAREDGARPPASSASAPAHPDPAPAETGPTAATRAVPRGLRLAGRWSRRAWGRLVVVVASLALAAAGVVWRQSQRIVFETDVQASVAVLAPPSLDWLRTTLLRQAMEQAHRRDIEIVVFRGLQSDNPFRGPHLEVRIERGDPGHLLAELSLTQGRARVRREYLGPAEGLVEAARTLLAAHAPSPSHAPSAAIDAYVAGQLAEAHFDRASALLEYRRALTLDAGMIDARIALAGLLFDQGRAEEAHEATSTISPADSTDPVRRCRIERLLARIAPERLGPAPCPRASMLMRVERLDLREALRRIERLSPDDSGAEEWLEEQTALILTLTRLQELERAGYEIERASEVARRAGWLHAALRLQGTRVSLHLHRGERKAAAELQRGIAAGFEALGDLSSAAVSRVWVQRAEPIVPGAAMEQRRVELRTLIDQLDTAGNLRAEIEALLLLARMERDRPEDWAAILARARLRIHEARLDDGNGLQPYYLAGELLAARRYREALAEIYTLRRQPKQHPRADSWALSVMVESLFWLDELDRAAAAISEMEEAGLDIASWPPPCFNAWVLIEAGRRQRATAYLERCRDGKFSAGLMDYGLVADARRHELDGMPARAWSLLRPRLETLLAIREPDRQDAEALALIARHAARLPDADPAQLSAAATALDRVAALDGAGPTVRNGAALLREALCRRTAAPDCSAADRDLSMREPLAVRLLPPAAR